MRQSAGMPRFNTWYLYEQTQSDGNRSFLMPYRGSLMIVWQANGSAPRLRVVSGSQVGAPALIYSPQTLAAPLLRISMMPILAFVARMAWRSAPTGMCPVGYSIDSAKSDG